jgi:CBS domain-containing protein
MPLVREVMSAPVVTEKPDVVVPDLVQLLEDRAISAVPIVDGTRLVGIVSTTDLVQDEAKGPGGRRVARDLMRAPVIVIGPDATIDEAAHRMVEHRVHRLVVEEGDRVVGIISARDLLEDVKRAKITMPIAELMTSDLVTVDIGDPIEEALAKLAVARVHGIVVLDGTRPVGVFTHTEALYARKLPRELRLKDPVEEIMSYETICLDTTTPVFRAAAHAIAMNVRRILVVDKHHLAGVLSCLDLLRPFASGARR